MDKNKTENKIKLFIVSYDMESDYEYNDRRKRISEVFEGYGAICLTQSTWLCPTPNTFECEDLYNELDEAINPKDEFFAFAGHADSFRLFVSEITGKVCYENLVCENEHKNALWNLLKESESVEDGWA